MRIEAGASGGQRLRKLFAALLFIRCAGLVFGQEAVLTFTAPPGVVMAGCRTGVWLNVLNPSAREIAWTFPKDLEGRIESLQGIFDITLERSSSAPTGEVRIAPGAFARGEYLLPVPALVTGQVVMVFAPLRANRMVLDVQAPPATAVATAKGKGSRFRRLFEEVEPLEPGRPFDPARFFREHFSAYEPFYFIAGMKSPNAKFQISFKYQLLYNEGYLATNLPALKGFHLAYTQTSLWDWNGPSAPFFDTSYKPEFLYSRERVAGGGTMDWFQLDLQGGVKHESNGKDGSNSRSLNLTYLRPTLTLGRDNGLQLTLQPRAWVYLGDLSDNPDIADYRGYADLRAILGWKRGLQLSAFGRMGREANHASLQLDLTYPAMRIFRSFSLYLHVQYFTGYGESLLEYNRRSENLRAGFSLYR